MKEIASRKDQDIWATVVPGHHVASGQNGNPRFPDGTLRMQLPHFLDRGLDLSPFYLGTVNISLAPRSHRIIQPRYIFRNVKWHPNEPAEDFSFFDCRVPLKNSTTVEGLVYYPHPDTKPEHFQQSDVLELILPHIEELHYGDQILIVIPSSQMVIE